LWAWCTLTPASISAWTASDLPWEHKNYWEMLNSQRDNKADRLFELPSRLAHIRAVHPPWHFSSRSAPALVSTLTMSANPLRPAQVRQFIACPWPCLELTSAPSAINRFTCDAINPQSRFRFITRLNYSEPLPNRPL
jgi:hypothetical protein